MPDYKISQLPLTTDAKPGDFIIINQDNVNTKRIDVSNLITDIGGDTYLDIRSSAGEQTVASTSKVTFKGLCEFEGGSNITGSINGASLTLTDLGEFQKGIKISGGDSSGVVNGLWSTNGVDDIILSTNDVISGAFYGKNKYPQVALAGSYVDGNTCITANNINPDKFENTLLTIIEVPNTLTQDLTGNYVFYTGPSSGSLTGKVRLNFAHVSSTTANGSYSISEDLVGYEASYTIGSVEVGGIAVGFASHLNDRSDQVNLNFYSAGNAPSFFKGDINIGGSYALNTRQLWESTLTEEQKEQLDAGTFTVPANVAYPGDGSFARQWWYDNQSPETQASIDSGDLDYPNHLLASTFVDTFASGDQAKTSLGAQGGAQFAMDISNDQLEYERGLSVTRFRPIDPDYNQTMTFMQGPSGHQIVMRSPYNNAKGLTIRNYHTQLDDPTEENPDENSPRTSIESARLTLTTPPRPEEGSSLYGHELIFEAQYEQMRIHGDKSLNTIFKIGRNSCTYFIPPIDADGEIAIVQAKPELKKFSKESVSCFEADVNFTSSDDTDIEGSELTVGITTGFLAQGGLSVHKSTERCAAFEARLDNATPGQFNYSFYNIGNAPMFNKSFMMFGTDTLNNERLESPVNVESWTSGNGTYIGPSYVKVCTDNSNNNYAGLFVNRCSSDTGHLIRFTEAGVIAGNFRLDGSGGVIGPNVSDYRLKENVVDLPSAVDVIKNLRPVNYNFKNHPNKKRPGFIAHEVAELVPSAVVGEKDEKEAVGTLFDYNGVVLETEVAEPQDLTYTEDVTDDNGVTTQETRTRTWTSTGTKDVYQNFDETKLIPFLTKALQEALERIEILEANQSS